MFSLVGAAVISAFLVFVVVFIFVYPVTRDFVLGLVAMGIGIVSDGWNNPFLAFTAVAGSSSSFCCYVIPVLPRLGRPPCLCFVPQGCTMIVKTVAQTVLRKRTFSSLYRTDPRSANYANLFFECWYIATGVLVVFSRLSMFLAAGALWLGRIDVEFLHPNVKVLGKPLDQVPVSYKRDMLVHEAHSHPYLDRLSGMYLLRLRDGDKFGSVAGTTWRCLFACSLMPWMVKYRVNTSSRDDPSLKPKKKTLSSALKKKMPSMTTKSTS